MLIKCSECGKEINPSFYTYCNACLIPLFKSSGKKQLKQAIYTQELKEEKFFEDVPIKELKPRSQVVTHSRTKIITVTVIFLFALALAIWRMYPFIFGENSQDKRLLIVSNMTKLQALVNGYKTVKNSYPVSLNEIFKNNSLIELQNPFSKSTIEGEAWGDFNKYNGIEKEGLVLYKFISKDKYEIYGYEGLNKPITKNGQPIVITQDTRLTKPEELL